MDEDIIKTIKEKFDSLPESIQEMILSTHYQETLIEIGKQYQLNVEQLGILERETTLVMMGLTPTTNFEAELTRELHVDTVKGSQVVKDINEKIFLKIRELLKLMNTPVGETPSVEETENTQKNDTEVLNSAGIGIIPEKLELGTSEKPAENREDILEKIEKPEETHPILTQKLSTSVQIPTVKTEHTLQNLSSNDKENLTTTTSNKPKIDPYREVPE
ncbi:MAG: hypothetical protein US45_C0055G0009 [Candidatus Nomurabacteria bacterium GW2011_GWA1_37_20]|uniref:Uncharacterized protein n=2 Tax=Parcubacteria group TaxID=1794811 RepID=A0A0G0KDH6_9BACT|nr:MAG: hypothetical protein US41_C0011G0010 [Parcubacteria group bacterium GW2011_GWB1_37_13]KKQ29915.1 MAG: hypothetical protein US45_C0055G0009 [Candidatus Nomurabacteria bacterium GW2011_GWA1_37_20]KKQ47194.1 MAG: hypothetical protein US65_C0014G0006 [Candidatus Yanofskybacteria bacterium GW2011_GWC2_37_9]